MKKFVENPLLSEMLSAYKQSEFLEHLSFYEYCTVVMHMDHVSGVSELTDQIRIEQSLRENFHVSGEDNDEGEL